MIPELEGMVGSAKARRHIEILQSHGMTQKRIGELAGVARKTIGNIVAGQEFVGRRTEQRLLSVLPPEPEDVSWMERAECTTDRAYAIAAEYGKTPLDLFFTGFDFETDRKNHASRLKQVAAAKAVCEPCQVKQRCLEVALERPELNGMWGGLTQTEITHIRKQGYRK